MPDQLVNLQTSPNDKPVVIGLYGLPGSGKSYLLQQLKQELEHDHYAFYEGSEVLNGIVPGGLKAFMDFEKQTKTYWREKAIESIGKDCTESGKVGVVTGHFMFWREKNESGSPVYTQRDWDTYTHILYLNVAADIIAIQRRNDKERRRELVSPVHLAYWRDSEKFQLREICRQNNILFFSTSSNDTDTFSRLIRDFRAHNESYNLSRAESRLDEALSTLSIGKGQLETMLVLDGDRTLAPEDTGALFWEKERSAEDPLKGIFGGPLGYSYTAFRQAVLMYEERAKDQRFDAHCADVASAVTMYPEFLSLLRLVQQKKHIGAVIVTCGLRLIWEKVLENAGLSDAVKVLGGGRIADGFVVTGEVKGAIVNRLRNIHQMYVWAFGDSPLDLDMLKKADQAIVVVGDEQTRSKSMEKALTNAVDNEGLRACQVVLPSSASPRLDSTKPPLIQLTNSHFIASILYRHSPEIGLQVNHATDRCATKLLATVTRDATVAGPALREAHRRIGWYLATEFLSETVGLEEYPIPHVQGGETNGYRLAHEQKTTIVALMRGGEPMALGVNDAFPLAMFVHASSPEDVKLHHVQEQATVLLVDSVVNSGKTIIDFVQRLRTLQSDVRIMVVTGVAQAQSLEGNLKQNFSVYRDVSLVALRLSDNKYTGSGGTDTGNRLFNTTHLP